MDATCTWHQAPSAAAGGVCVAPADPAAVASMPINARMYKRCVSAIGDTKEVAHTKFKQTMQACATTCNDPIPRKLDYPQLCHGYCISDVHNNHHELRQRIHLMLTQFVRQMCKLHTCKPVQLSLYAFMFSFEICSLTSRRLHGVFQLSLGNAQSGPHPAFQGFVRFKVVTSLSEAAPIGEFILPGALVEPECGEYVICNRSLSQGDISCGAGPLITPTYKELSLCIV